MSSECISYFAFTVLISVLVLMEMTAGHNSFECNVSINLEHHAMTVSHLNTFICVSYVSITCDKCMCLADCTLLCTGPFEGRMNCCWGWRHGRCFECREPALVRRPRAVSGTDNLYKSEDQGRRQPSVLWISGTAFILDGNEHGPSHVNVFKPARALSGCAQFLAS